MSRYFPPRCAIEGRWAGPWILGMLLAALPLSAGAEVTLTTSVERISSTVNLPASEPIPGSVPAATPQGTVQANVLPGDVASGERGARNRNRPGCAGRGLLR